jgi:ferredoxin-like protein FixX
MPSVRVDRVLTEDGATGKRVVGGHISVEYAACLECGTCLAVAATGALKWHYPRGGFGIQFREG